MASIESKVDFKIRIRIRIRSASSSQPNQATGVISEFGCKQNQLDLLTRGYGQRLALLAQHDAANACDIDLSGCVAGAASLEPVNRLHS